MLKYNSMRVFKTGNKHAPQQILMVTDDVRKPNEQHNLAVAKAMWEQIVSIEP